MNVPKKHRNNIKYLYYYLQNTRNAFEDDVLIFTSNNPSTLLPKMFA